MAATHASRTTLVIAAGVLACAAIAAPFTIGAVHHARGSDPRAGVPTPTPMMPTLPQGAFRGDVDGDGLLDVVSLKHEMLRVDLASGATVRQLLQDAPRIEGLADVGSAGLAIATASGRHGRTWTVWTLRGDGLVRVPTRGSLVLGDQPGFATTWVSERTVYDGTLDPLQKDADHVVVLVRSWALDDGRLAPSRAGLRCWDRSSSQAPAPCAPGKDWRYDVGRQGDLPSLLPADHAGSTATTGVRFVSGDRWQVRRLRATSDPQTGRWLLQYDGRNGRESVPVPVGWAPTLFRSPVRVGDLTDGVLLSQEGGDSDTWRVYVQWAGGIQQLATRGPVALGGGFGPDGDTAYLSWMGKDGRLYTRIGTARPGLYHVYAWQPVGGSAYTPPVLRAVDLGQVCLDETLDTYGTCSG
jgi:hypothetical protein